MSTTTTILKSKGVWSRLLLSQTLQNPSLKPSLILTRPISHLLNQPQPQPQPKPTLNPSSLTHLRFFSITRSPIQELLGELEHEKRRDREKRIKAGLPPDNPEDEEDFMGVGPLIEKIEKETKKNGISRLDMLYEEPTDSDREEDERDTFDAKNRRAEVLEKKLEKHEELVDSLNKAKTPDEKWNWMMRIDKFEKKHFSKPLEYKVIDELVERLKESTGKERFMLLQKINRAMRLVKWKEAYDPNNPENFGVIKHRQVGPSFDIMDNVGFEKQKQMMKGAELEEDGEEFDDTKERDAIMLENLNDIDKKLEEKLAQLDFTFGKKGKILEQEIKDLAEERRALAEKKRTPLYRKGFDVKLINFNRTCKVTKGGRVTKYSATVVCGNYHGVVGFAKAKGPTVPIALQKAYEKVFQNLHYVDRHEEHTIAHAVQTSYKKSKIYLWPASTRSGMIAGKHVQTILLLAGFKNIKSKVIGSRNPYNTVKAVFKALAAIESPKDVQQKFGRTVVESYLL
ncbi:hypothetical protein GIB67_032361 [Kingdonia uniflora]|uniref:S5 DRBM domain-containing protein n=1 Tax=Kingdonia uniflora TaxID=39325 RepID=A0A7J7MIK8_9MAGN|nr:hypothetical protein GIB67_032361 [Kingdonia uniflora]